MSRLEELTVGAVLRGILPGAISTVVSRQWFVSNFPVDLQVAHRLSHKTRLMGDDECLIAAAQAGTRSSSHGAANPQLLEFHISPRQALLTRTLPLLLTGAEHADRPAGRKYPASSLMRE